MSLPPKASHIRPEDEWEFEREIIIRALILTNVQGRKTKMVERARQKLIQSVERWREMRLKKHQSDDDFILDAGEIG